MQYPDLYEYLDTSLYLKDLYKYKKAKVPNFSYDLWATELEFKSRSHLRDIVIGQMPLTETLIPLFINGLKLDSQQTEYFTLLAKYSYAQSKQLKEVYGKSLIMLWKAKLHQIEVQDLQSFLADPILPVVFTYLSFDDTSSEISEISKRLNCDVLRVQNALKCLVWQKLVDGKIAEDGSVQYKTAQPFFKIPYSPNNHYLKQFHLDGLKLAEQAQELSVNDRRFYSSFVALSVEQFEEAQKMIRECNDRILSLFDSPTLDQRRIFRLNTQIFSMSAQQSEGKKEESGAAPLENN